MTTTDWILDLALIGVVVFQVRGRRLTTRWLILPVVIVSWAAIEYLRAFPTGGNDLWLIGLSTALGLVLGALCGIFTTVRLTADGAPFAQARVLAAVFWVLGVGLRFAFQLYATHGGGAAIVRFSAQHQITSIQAWVTSLLLMAIAEVLARTVVLWVRAMTLQRQASVGASEAAEEVPSS